MDTDAERHMGALGTSLLDLCPGEYGYASMKLASALRAHSGQTDAGF